MDIGLTRVTAHFEKPNNEALEENIRNVDATDDKNIRIL